MNEAVNDSTKLVAQAIEALKAMSCYGWVNGTSANEDIGPVIQLLEDVLIKLTSTI